MGHSDSAPASPVVLVTGAGKGLGRAIVQQFSDQGWVVLATDVDSDALFKLAQEIPRILTCTLDVTDSESVKHVSQYLETHCGCLDALINNAGIIGYFPVSEIEPEVLISHFQINTFGAVRTTQACLDLLVASKGRVINISSESYRLRTPFQVYQSSKLALEGLSDVLRRELSHLDVQVTTIRPGAINTELFAAMHEIQNPVENSRLTSPFERFRSMLERNAPKRLSEPEAVARLVYRAATDRRMRPHYEINNMLSLKFMSLLPTAVADWLIKRLLRR